MSLVNKLIFTYWETPKGSIMPSYLEMCMDTWSKYMPDYKTVILNPDNMNQWLGRDYLSPSDLKGLSLPQRKDIVSYGVLHENGGIFLDMDTIAVKDISGELEKLDNNNLYFFGDPKTHGVHCGIIICPKARNQALFECMKGAASALSESKKVFSRHTLRRIARNAVVNARNISNGIKPRFEGFMAWDYFGKAIIDPVAKKYKESVGIIDRIESGSFLEEFFFKTDRKVNYINLYFTHNNIDLEPALSRVDFGLINLHNSWTPHNYKSLSRERIMSDDLFISRLLRFVLDKSVGKDESPEEQID